MKFTNSKISTIKAPAGKPEHIEWDDDMPGFGLRIRVGEKREHRTFIVQYKIAAKHRRITIGNAAKVKLDSARKEARTIFSKVGLGQDPATQKADARMAAAQTVGNLIGQYLEAKATDLRARTLAETKRYLETQWKPLHHVAVSAVTRATVAAQSRAIAKASGPVAANRARASLSAMFRWGMGEGLCDENPVAGTNKQTENDPRDRTLSDAELARIWLAARDNDNGRIVRLLLLTGCRRDEIGSLQWSEIDMDGRTITLPPERTKNHQKHVVPLSDSAMKILQAVPARFNRDYVFGEGNGGFSGWSRAKAALDDAAEVKGWRLHDLHRTVRTSLGGLGVFPWIAEAILNHLSSELVRTYAVSGKETETNFDRKLEQEKRAALEAWASHVAVAVAQASGANVTNLKARKSFHQVSN